MWMQTTRMLTRKFSLQVKVETFEEEGGEEGEAVTDLVSAGEAMAHAKPTRILLGRINNKTLRDRILKAPLNKRRLPLPQQDPLRSATRSSSQPRYSLL